MLPPAPFVLGAGRSGTTLLRMMLDSHPELAIPAETGFIGQAHASWNPAEPIESFVESAVSARNWRHFGFGREELTSRLVQARVTSLVDALRVFYSLCAQQQGKPRWGDKTPAHVRFVPLIARHLPEARFVHLVRDGRDVALSLRGLTFGPQSLETAAQWWKERVEAARSGVRGLPAGTSVEIRFEDLVAEPEEHLHRICELAKLPWSDRMLVYHERSAARLVEYDDVSLARTAVDVAARERLLAVRQRLRRLPDSSRIARWRADLSSDEVRRFVSVAGDLLDELGYETS
jgi:Sulfotransferase family